MNEMFRRTGRSDRRRIALAALGILLLLLPASTVQAQDPPIQAVTLQQGLGGYVGTTDTYLDLGNATTVWGSADRLRVKTTLNADSLLRFDLSAIPAGTAVLDAELRIYAFDSSAVGVPVSPIAGNQVDQVPILYPSITMRTFKVLRPWSEDAATWVMATDMEPWGLPGCQQPGVDYASEYSDEIIGFSGLRTWVRFDVTEMTQEWVDDPDSNFGVVIKAYLHRITVAGSAWSSEGPLPWYRPKLVITYH